MRASVGIVVVIIVAACAMAGESDAFRSATAGFEITKPADWHYLTAEQNQENLGRVELTDDEYKEALLKYATVPLVATLSHREGGAEPEVLAEAEAVLAQLGPDLTTSR